MNLLFLIIIFTALGGVLSVLAASVFLLLSDNIQAKVLPHGVSFAQKGVQVASLDHSIWFHRPFKIDDWLLYDMDSPSSSQGRGFNRGNIFNQNGELVASVCQEALIRKRIVE